MFPVVLLFIKVDNNLVKYLVAHHLTDTRWQEVFLLVAGLMRSGTDELLLLMEKKADAFLDTPVGTQKLVPILNWAENITQDSTGDLKPVAKRAIANAITNSISYAYTNAYVNFNGYASSDFNANFVANFDTDAYSKANAHVIAKNYADDYTNDRADAYAVVYANASSSVYGYAIDYLVDYFNKLHQLPKAFHSVNLIGLIAKLNNLKTKIPSNKEERKVRRQFGFKIVEIVQSAFYLQPELVNLSEEELRQIDREYFYIYNLMLQCKTAALSVNPQTWAEIEDRMLRVL